MFLSSQGVKVAFLAGPDQRAKQLEAGGTACDMRWRPRTADRNDNDSGIQWNTVDTATETEVSEVGLEVT